jgi:hypothetical protein
MITTCNATNAFYLANSRHYKYNNSQENNFVNTHQKATSRQIRQLNVIEFEPNFKYNPRSLSQNQNDFNDARARC